MLARLFPKQFDNDFRGHPLAVWLLVPIVVIRLLQGVNCVLQPAAIAATADAIPLARFTPDASATIVLLFALSAISFLLFALQAILALLRYRSMIPLLYVWVLVDTVARRALNVAHPTVQSVAPGGHAIGFYVNLALLVAMIAGFVLSMIRRPVG
jgi:hypothetical protein